MIPHIARLEHLALGIEKYIEGNWEMALENLKKAKQIIQNDGPTKALIYYINNNDSSMWCGFR